MKNENIDILNNMSLSISQSVSELCDNSKNSKIVVKIGLEKFFQF